MIEPRNNPKSECFECAGDCWMCSGNQKDWNEDNYPLDFDSEPSEEKKPQTYEKKILKCIMCDWEHHDPNEWQRYERAPNDTMQKVCGGCGRITLKEITRTLNV